MWHGSMQDSYLLCLHLNISCKLMNLLLKSQILNFYPNNAISYSDKLDFLAVSQNWLYKVHIVALVIFKDLTM